MVVDFTVSIVPNEELSSLLQTWDQDLIGYRWKHGPSGIDDQKLVYKDDIPAQKLELYQKYFDFKDSQIVARYHTESEIITKYGIGETMLDKKELLDLIHTLINCSEFDLSIIFIRVLEILDRYKFENICIKISQ